jgi:prepilin-type N-terminal cleavage/methylation domain-containing protein
MFGQNDRTCQKKGNKNCQNSIFYFAKGKEMKRNKQSGFSLIELLLVVVIIGIIATVALPYLIKAKYAAENGSMFATLRAMASAQINFYSQNGRYATLPELNISQHQVFGTTVGNNIHRGSFTIDMGSVAASDPSLRTNFTITATKTVGYNDLPYVIAISADGRVVQITP